MATTKVLKAANVSSVVRQQLLSANTPISSARIAVNGNLPEEQRPHVTNELAALRKMGFVTVERGTDPSFKTTKLYSADKAALYSYCFG